MGSLPILIARVLGVVLPQILSLCVDKNFNELGRDLDSLRQELGRNNTNFNKSFPKKIVFDLPTSFDKIFSDSLKTILVERLTESWMFFYGSLKEYVKKYNSIPLNSYISKDGYKLGSWTNFQRTNYNKGKVPQDRIALLEKIPG